MRDPGDKRSNQDTAVPHFSQLRFQIGHIFVGPLIDKICDLEHFSHTLAGSQRKVVTRSCIRRILPKKLFEWKDGSFDLKIPLDTSASCCTETVPEARI